MSSQNVFIKPNEFYVRKINPIKQYIEQTGFYLSKLSGKDFTTCCKLVKDNLKKDQFPQIINPIVRHYHRGDNLDKDVREIPLTSYINEIIDEERVLAPTFTTYLSTKKKESPLVGFVDQNKRNRSKAKKEAFKAKAEKKMDLYNAKHNEQNNMKLYNNALSGAFATEGCIVHNPTAHSTLTSTTRLESSISNSSNEKLIAGNRHYFNKDLILNNLISISYISDKQIIRDVMLKYNLHYPTVEDVIDCIKWSANFYILYFNPVDHKEIYDFILTMTPEERAAFVYVSDLYHIRKYNDSFIREFIRRSSLKVTNKIYDDPYGQIKSINEATVNLGHIICMSEVKGIGKDYSKISKEAMSILVGTCENIDMVFNDYKDFIEAFFLTENLPMSTSHIPNMIRRSVVLSDTDSTMFSVDEYIQWYFGDIYFSDETFAVSGVIMHMATQCIAHLLAIFSANANVDRAKLFDIAMKPEYAFPVFAQTSVSKHYYTYKIIQEGDVFEKPEMEIKGVHLKNSAMPKNLVKAAHEKMKNILFTVASNKKIRITDEIKEVANLERSILSSVINGEPIYYKKSKIKNATSYAQGPDKSPYARHVFWNNVFGPKYGTVSEPPYVVIKIPTKLVNKTELGNWINNIEDKELSDRLFNNTLKQGKQNLPTIYISLQYVTSYGIPPEILRIVDTDRIILDLTNTNRMILESLGFFIKPNLLLSGIGY